MNEFERMFANLDEENLSELLENETAEIDKNTAKKIKYLSMKKVGFEADESSKIKAFPKKIIALAASFVVVAGCSVFFGLYMNEKNKPTVTTQLQTSSSFSTTENPIMLAIASGDDSLIEKLLTNPLLVSEQVLEFAVNYSNLLSYDTIQSIAKAVVDIFGSTGLDSILEDAILGKSDDVIKELSKTETVNMTPTEKLAFFFTAAFCDSDAVDEFVKKGADINSTDGNGNNIGEIALKYNNSDTVKYAEQHGIN